MSISKRYITKDTILRHKNESDIFNLINVEAVFLDNWASKFYKYFEFSYQRFSNFRLEQINNNDNKLFFGDFPKGLSNILIKLFNEPNKYDIEFCREALENLNVEFERIDLENNLDDLVEYYKNKIINFYGS